MKRIEIITSVIFDEMVEELGIDSISDIDISDELNRHKNTKEEEGRIETWTYDSKYGTLEVYLEDLKN